MNAFSNSVSTISGVISAIVDDEFAIDPPPLNTLKVVQQKFKDNEQVQMVFEAYQIVNDQYTSRLLAIVKSVAGGTHAIFALTATQIPPQSSADLTIDKLFPINDNFQIYTDKKGSISQLQFELKNSEESPHASKYFYYPITSDGGSVDFITLHARIVAIQQTRLSNSDPENTLSYCWLNDYRQIGEVKMELKRREKEYMVYKEMSIYCATWNVNNKSFHTSPLHLWLAACAKPPDIYAIGLQELDVGAMAVARNEKTPDPMWIQKMLESLHPGTKYLELKSVRLVGMMLTIFIKEKLYNNVPRCREKSVPRGVLTVMGNKGGVAVSLQLNEGNFCFVNSHLAAHTNYVETRNADYAGILRGIVFDDEERRTINDHDHIFWLGDLNYRIEEPPGWQWPMPLSADNSYEMLLPFDQLGVEMRKGNCFLGYTEGKIRFKPTYKYDVGTDTFDSSEKKRTPAYCDRILWKGARIEQTSYNSIMDIRYSDHKPVYATFIVKVKTRDEKKFKRIHEEVLKLVDKRENENQPQIGVDKTVIDFGLVRFNETETRSFLVSNKCVMTVTFIFKVKDPPINAICEKWLNLEPQIDTLFKDSSKSVRVKLSIDYRSIRGLLQKIRTTNGRFDFDILILHVQEGPDIFLTVTGEYKPSCFGLSVETLCRTNRAICEYSQAQIKDLMNDNTPEYRATMPREFFLLIDYLLKQGDKVEGAFSSLDYKLARNPDFNLIRDWLDHWSEDEFPGTPQAAAEALLMLLDLPEKPLLDPFVEDLLQTNSATDAMEYIGLLSSPRRNVFVHLCMFLSEGIEKRYYNVQSVASTFGRVLLRADNNSFKDIDRELRCRQFMNRFISSDLSSLPNNANAGSSSATALDRGAVGDNRDGGSNLLELS